MAEYIDREVFKKSVEEYYCKPCKADGKDHNGCWCRACWVDDMLDEIDCFQPAADVAPVVHAHWQPYEDTVQCSACGFGTFMDGYFFAHGECTHANDRSFRFSFCPNCGAKMDGGSENG